MVREEMGNRTDDLLVTYQVKKQDVRMDRSNTFTYDNVPIST